MLVYISFSPQNLLLMLYADIAQLIPIYPFSFSSQLILLFFFNASSMIPNQNMAQVFQFCLLRAPHRSSQINCRFLESLKTANLQDLTQELVCRWHIQNILIGLSDMTCLGTSIRRQRELELIPEGKRHLVEEKRVDRCQNEHSPTQKKYIYTYTPCPK